MTVKDERHDIEIDNKNNKNYTEGGRKWRQRSDGTHEDTKECEIQYH